MQTYKLTTGISIIRLSDNAYIPSDPSNIDYQEYLAWVAAGNTPEPITQPTNAEKLAQYKVQRDALLTTTDIIYSCNDYTIAGQPITTDQRTEIKNYRQALRDAPEQSYPNFPQKPSWL